MEADWAAEVGPDLPCIDVPWEGFVDLRQDPSALMALAEAAAHPALRESLLALNTEHSHMFTAKCDAWTLARYDIDPDEFAAQVEQACEGFASYIDMLHRDPPPGFLRVPRALGRAHRKSEKDLPPQRPRRSRNSPGERRFISRLRATLYAAGCGADATTAYSRMGGMCSAPRLPLQ